MNPNKIKEEIQFITGVVTDDFDYLVYLLLKGGTKDSKSIQRDEPLIQQQPEFYDDIFNERYLDDWFNNL